MDLLRHSRASGHPLEMRGANPVVLRSIFGEKTAASFWPRGHIASASRSRMAQRPPSLIQSGQVLRAAEASARGIVVQRTSRIRKQGGQRVGRPAGGKARNSRPTMIACMNDPGRIAQKDIPHHPRVHVARGHRSKPVPHCRTGESGHRCPLDQASMSKAIWWRSILLCPCAVILHPSEHCRAGIECQLCLLPRGLRIWSATGDKTASAGVCAGRLRQTDMNPRIRPSRGFLGMSQSCVSGSGFFQTAAAFWPAFWTGVALASPFASSAFRSAP